MKWFRKLWKPSVLRAAARPRWRPDLEVLEHRNLLSTTYMVTLSSDNGAGSGGVMGASATQGDLRYCLNKVQTGDTIQFASVVTSIALKAGLVLDTSGVTIQGNPNGTTPLVTIDGSGIQSNSPTNSDCLDLFASNCTISGLAFVGAPDIPAGQNGDGLYITGNGNLVESCYLGLQANGTHQGNLGDGIQIQGSQNSIGGGTAGTGNIISGNNFQGIELDQGAIGNVIQRNTIGLDAGGNSDGNTAGILILSGANSNIIGGGTPGGLTGNIICANSNAGINIQFGTDNRVEGNTIGTNLAGAPGLGNQVAGIYLFPGSREQILDNVISGNSGAGININGGTSNTIQGNDIGVDATGMTAIPNTGNGIFLQGGTTSNLIGGLATDSSGAFLQTNTIAANGLAGINIQGDGDSGNIIQANDIGVGRSATTGLGNAGGAGVVVNPGSSDYTVIEYNYIGNSTGHALLAYPTDSNALVGYNSSYLAPNSTYAIANSDAGSGTVNLTDSTGKLAATLHPFGSNFVGDAHVAQGDVTGDGTDDIIVAAGSGGGPQVTIYDGKTLQVSASFYAFAPSFTGGVFVASADVNGDLAADIIVAAGTGGAPQVTVFDGRTLQPIASFYAFAPSFRGGVRVAVDIENVNGVRTPVLVCSAGPGGGPQVLVIDGTRLNQVLANGEIAPSAVLASFYAMATNFTGGLFVAVGDLNGDGKPDIVCGADAGGGPQLTTWNGATFQMMGSFYALPSNYTTGVRVALGDFAGDRHLNLIASAGPGADPRVNIFDGTTLSLVNSYNAFDPSFAGGVFVSATR